MKNLFLCATFCCFSILSTSQNKKINSEPDYFDEKSAIEQCFSKGMKASEIKGYVEYLKNDFSSKKALAKQSRAHSPYEVNKDVLEKVIYLSPNKTASAGCPNMGFENSNFSGWTGSYGTMASGTPFAVYNATSPNIINSAGNNVPLANTINYHTIMTTPASNPIYPNCVGYDSIACKIVGTNTVSQIPVVSPFSSDGASVRLNGAVANYRACRLKYITTTSSTNQKLSYSFALVLDDGGHAASDAPHFSIQVKNEATGTLLSACNQSFTMTTPSSPSDSMFTSVMGFNNISCRKWRLYTVDLSSLPIGTNVSVNFEVGGCPQGGHFGYAYVDAECGSGSGNGTDLVVSNMCSGSTTASLIAPLGYNSYQWFDPSNNPISGATTNTLSVSNPTLGNIYSVQLTGTNGCVDAKTVTISNSTITINNISSSGSCANGNSGSATVNPFGSSGTYSYTWTSIATGSVVSNSQTAINLNPGNYSVEVSSGTCGQTSATVTVPITSPAFSQIYKPYCGNSTYIAGGTGTNYQWYAGSTMITGLNGTNDTLMIANAVNGANYTIVYTNGGGCKDSIRYVLNQITGGSVNLSNIIYACPGTSNGSVVLNLTPAYSGPYTFIVSDMMGVISNTTISSLAYSVTGLGAGTYTTTVNDGNCSYNNTLTINNTQTTFSMTSNNNSFCSPSDTAKINFNFGPIIPSSCGLSSTGNCSSAGTIVIGNGTSVNSTTSYPAIYSNWYKNARHQILYRASELTAAGVLPGKISSISFNISAVSGTTVYPNFTIKMKCTSVNDLTGASFDNGGLTQVYFSSSVNIAPGWNSYQFPTAYEWDGISNILIDVCTDMTATYTSNSSSPYTTTTFGSVLYLNSDGIVACMTTNPASSSSNRPNIKFENCGANSPSSYTISVSSNGTIVQNYNNDSIKIVPVTTPTADIVYTITVTNPQGGCTASQTYTMSSNLSAIATVTNASCASCPNGAVQATASCGIAPYMYLWSPGGATTQSVSGLIPGCYTVTVTDANMNSVNEQACISFATKMEETSALTGLSVYPNPGNGIFNLISEILITKLEITLFNPLGQTILHETVLNSKEAQIDISKLSKGVYYLKTNTNEGSKLFKLILE